MSDRFDVLALGETMLSLVAEDGPLATATSFHATHGGAESNACIALAPARTAVCSSVALRQPGIGSMPTSSAVPITSGRHPGETTNEAPASRLART